MNGDIVTNFEDFVSELNTCVGKLGFDKFRFQSYHYSNTRKTINEQGYSALISYIDTLEKQYLEGNNTSSFIGSERKSATNKVFIVHGKDKTALLETESLLRRLDLEPIILSKMPNNGDTIIEKFEKFSNVNYAIVLLTPDDVGAIFEIILILHSNLEPDKMSYLN